MKRVRFLVLWLVTDTKELKVSGYIGLEQCSRLVALSDIYVHFILTDSHP